MGRHRESSHSAPCSHHKRIRGGEGLQRTLGVNCSLSGGFPFPLAWHPASSQIEKTLATLPPSSPPSWTYLATCAGRRKDECEFKYDPAEVGVYEQSGIIALRTAVRGYPWATYLVAQLVILNVAAPNEHLQGGGRQGSTRGPVARVRSLSQRDRFLSLPLLPRPSHP